MSPTLITAICLGKMKLPVGAGCGGRRAVRPLGGRGVNAKQGVLPPLNPAHAADTPPIYQFYELAMVYGTI